MELPKFRKWKRSCEIFASGKGDAKISQVVDGVAKIFQVAFGVAKFSRLDLAGAKFLHLDLVLLSSNGHNFFISAPICTPFEALDS